MNALDPFRIELRAALPARCFLKRDRASGALFVSDLPRFADDLEAVISTLRSLGYEARQDRGVCLVDLSRGRYTTLLAGLPECALPLPDDGNFMLWALAGRLLRTDTPPEEQPAGPVRLALLRLDAGETARLARELPPVLAELQRRRIPLPTGVGRLICLYLADNVKGGLVTC